MTWLVVAGNPVGKVKGRRGPLHYDSIVWHPKIALRLLQGGTIPEATGLILVSGKHRPVWHPEPGVEEAFFRPI